METKPNTKTADATLQHGVTGFLGGLRQVVLRCLRTSFHMALAACLATDAFFLSRAFLYRPESDGDVVHSYVGGAIILLYGWLWGKGFLSVAKNYLFNWPNKKFSSASLWSLALVVAIALGLNFVIWFSLIVNWLATR